MLSFTEDDYDLDYICTGLFDEFKLGHNYHVFGLKQRNRPHVRILTSNAVFTIQLMSLFSRSDLALDVLQNRTENRLSIGLRRDIRKNISLSRKLIKTIIYSIEGKLKAKRSFKISLGRKIKHGRVWNKDSSSEIENFERVEVASERIIPPREWLRMLEEARKKSEEARQPSRQPSRQLAFGNTYCSSNNRCYDCELYDCECYD